MISAPSFIVLDKNGRFVPNFDIVSGDVGSYFAILEAIVKQFEGGYGPKDHYPWRLLWGGEIVIPDRLYQVAVGYVSARRLEERNAVATVQAIHKPEWLKEAR